MPRQAFLFIFSCKARDYPTPSHPNALFFVSPSPLLIFPSLPCRPKPHSCRPERFFLSPRAKRGVPRLLRTSGRQGGRLSPRAPARGPPGDAVPNEVRDASLSLGGWRMRCFASLSMTGWRGMTGWRMSPRAPLLSPRGVSRGVPRHWRASGCHGGKLSPQAPLTQKVY